MRKIVFRKILKLSEPEMGRTVNVLTVDIEAVRQAIKWVNRLWGAVIMVVGALSCHSL